MHTLLRPLLVTILALTAGLTHAIDYRSVGEPAVLFDTPSDKGRPLFIVSTGTPVEVVVVLAKWVKVRDPGGAISWIESASLSPQRTLMVTAPNAIVRRAPDPGSEPVFEAVKDVVLELAAPPAAGWVQVRHRDGLAGFVRVTEVWGL
jgi:SH3-like domain-containing protein